MNARMENCQRSWQQSVQNIVNDDLFPIVIKYCSNGTTVDIHATANGIEIIQRYRIRMHRQQKKHIKIRFPHKIFIFNGYTIAQTVSRRHRQFMSNAFGFVFFPSISIYASSIMIIIIMLTFLTMFNVAIFILNRISILVFKCTSDIRL